MAQCLVEGKHDCTTKCANHEEQADRPSDMTMGGALWQRKGLYLYPFSLNVEPLRLCCDIPTSMFENPAPSHRMHNPHSNRIHISE